MPRPTSPSRTRLPPSRPLLYVPSLRNDSPRAQRIMLTACSLPQTTPPSPRRRTRSPSGAAPRLAAISPKRPPAKHPGLERVHLHLHPVPARRDRRTTCTAREPRHRYQRRQRASRGRGTWAGVRGAGLRGGDVEGMKVVRRGRGRGQYPILPRACN